VASAPQEVNAWEGPSVHGRLRCTKGYDGPSVPRPSQRGRCLKQIQLLSCRADVKGDESASPSPPRQTKETNLAQAAPPPPEPRADEGIRICFAWPADEGDESGFVAAAPKTDEGDESGFVAAAPKADEGIRICYSASYGRHTHTKETNLASWLPPPMQTKETNLASWPPPPRPKADEGDESGFYSRSPV